MRTEIERKFLVRGDGWRRAGAKAKPIHQGYLYADDDISIRVRRTGEHAYLTVKGTQVGATRAEYEYEIPVGDAQDMLKSLCQPPLIEKVRHSLVRGDVTWEIDVFEGANAGLIVAEVELESEDQRLDLPEWIGQEVTDDPRYLNANLAKKPFSQWSFTAAGDV
jgi:CYTH domain-containing protein